MRSDSVMNNDWESGVDESLRCELVPEKGRFPNIDATAQMRLVYEQFARAIV